MEPSPVVGVDRRMGRKGPWLIGLMVLSVVCFRTTPNGQQPAQPPPLPPAERFIANSDLNVSLLTATDSIRLGERLTLTLRFENRGTRPLRIVPRTPDPVFASASQPGVARVESNDAAAAARRIPVYLSPERLATIQPGEGWDLPLDTALLRTAPRFAPGEYTASVTYVNYPDYQYLHYDPPSTPTGIWEGMIKTAPIRFTITPPSPDDLAGWQELVQSDNVDRLTLELLAVSGDEGVSSLIRRFGGSQVAGLRSQILLALRLVDRLPMRDLLAAIEASTHEQERRSVFGSVEFDLLMRGRGTCDVLEYFVTQFGHFYGSMPPAVTAAFDSTASQCPTIRTLLRDTILGPSSTVFARAHAAYFLGIFQRPDDRVLLTDILERRVPAIPAPAPPYGDAVRSWAVMGLSRFKEPEVVEAVARALADEQRNRSIGTTLARALSDIGGPDVIPSLISALASSDFNLVIQAIMRLRDLKATAAVPRLVDLLQHSNPTVRSYASSALRQLGGPPVRDAMLTAAKGVGDVHVNALFYLAEHGDASLRELFLAGLESQTQSVREAAINGIRRFGTEDDFSRIRRLFDSAKPEVRGYLPSALGALTFAVHTYPTESDPGFWDTWYAQHRGTTRVEWAREALARADAPVRRWPFDATAQRDAVAFLTASRDRRFLPDFERAARSDSFAVRVEAARAIATFDRTAAGRLLVREFGSRFQYACFAANQALNNLTGLNRRVDCSDPRARVDAATAWQAALNAL